MNDHEHHAGSLTQFTLPRLERVIAGPGALDLLPAEMARYGCRRAVIVTGTTVGASPLTDRVRSLLGERCALVFTGARQHVPRSTVDALVAAVSDAGGDSLISVGGGSPIDTAKCAVHAWLDGRRSGRRDEPSVPVHIAVPTTLSAGEFTDVAGITDEPTRIKHALFDTRLAPRTVLADPVATRDTPAWLWAASGVRALDHAIETLYASRRHAISEPLAERAIAMLLEHLPASLEDTDGALAHRGACQVAAWLAVFGVTNAGFGLSHVLGHQIGPRWNVPHGFTSAIMLPHAMRLMAAKTPSRFDAIAGGLGIVIDARNPAPAASACAERTAAFIERLNLPSRLRDVGVPREELRTVADVVAAVIAGGEGTGRRSTAELDAARFISADDLEQILLAAY